MELFADRPLQGYGSGSFGRAFRRRAQGQPAAGRVGLAHAAGDGGGGAGPDRARRLSRRCWSAALHDAVRETGMPRAPPARRRGLDRRRRCVARAALAAMFVRPRRAHDGLRRVPRGPVHLGDPRAGLAVAPIARLAEHARPRPAAGARGAAGRRAVRSYLERLVAHGRRLHGLERHLEAVRGRAAADLHAPPDARRLRRRGGAAGVRRRGQHRPAAGHHRGAAALLLPLRGARRRGRGGRDRSFGLPARRRPRSGALLAPPFAGPLSEAAAGPPRHGADADRDRRTVGVHATTSC